jgi:hypothetical protein
MGRLMWRATSVHTARTTSSRVAFGSSRASLSMVAAASSSWKLGPRFCQLHQRRPRVDERRVVTGLQGDDRPHQLADVADPRAPRLLPIGGARAVPRRELEVGLSHGIPPCVVIVPTRAARVPHEVAVVDVVP